MAKADLDIGRLCAAMQRARLVLRKPRQERFDAVRQFVGKHWSEEGTAKENPINLLSMYVSIVGRKLIANNPRVTLQTWNKAGRPVVAAMEQWANRQFDAMNLSNTLQRVVLDALFSVGICKVALATPADSALGGWTPHSGQPFAERVDLDDLVFDIHARDFSEVGFIGHRYRAPLSVIRESKIYSRDRKDLSASDDRIYNMEGDERIGMLGRTTLGGSDVEEYEEHVDLWEVYLPRHRLVLTLRDDNLTGAAGGYSTDPNFGKALRIQQWLGPDCGPYHLLGFGHVPGNPMPKAPVQDLLDLHLAINRMLRKLIRKTDRQKEVCVYSAGAAEDAERIAKTDDGEWAKVDRPESVKAIGWGGPDQGTFQFFTAMKELFSWMAGNLDIMGGLSPQSKTAHQDAMLNANSSATLSEMQDRTVSLTSSVVKALCWYWHHDPKNIMRSHFAVPGLPEFGISRNVYPAGESGVGRLARNIPFDDLDIRVDPYSLQHKTPEQKSAAMTQVVTQIIMPMMQLLQQQGIAFDANTFLTKMSHYLDMPDLPEIITIQEPPEEEPSGGGGEPGMPQQTSREYVRRSIGGTPAGQHQELMQELSEKMPETNGELNGAAK